VPKNKDSSANIALTTTFIKSAPSTKSTEALKNHCTPKETNSGKYNPPATDT
jgi:hypothetical protein